MIQYKDSYCKGKQVSSSNFMKKKEIESSLWPIMVCCVHFLKSLLKVSSKFSKLKLIHPKLWLELNIKKDTVWDFKYILPKLKQHELNNKFKEIVYGAVTL